MHWVDRGPEPTGLGAIRGRYTPRWIGYYRNGVGNRPTDSRWRDFRKYLGQRFHLQCGYCESICEGQVDHFQPKSRFPELVYEWSNWIFACSACNQAKGWTMTTPPLPHPSIGKYCFMLPSDARFGSQDYWLAQSHQTLAYVRVLQYWAEEAQLWVPG